MRESEREENTCAPWHIRPGYTWHLDFEFKCLRYLTSHVSFHAYGETTYENSPESKTLTLNELGYTSALVPGGNYGSSPLNLSQDPVLNIALGRICIGLDYINEMYKWQKK